ncbi:MAG: UDP-N-acetylmuramoyl-tripeptide--D-alanyl-D-alanine ligase [Chakrabartia sp.]
MTGLWTAADIAAATGGVASADFTVGGVTFDSREVGPGDLFLALKGEVTDGHRFIDAAFAQGAAGALVSSPVPHPHILVKDTTAALNALGVAARARVSAKIAGVTGSVGKTGTKEALAAALARAQRGPVHRSVKSYNNHTGVPLSLARMPADTQFGVFEMGMNHAGEIAGLTRLVRPHVAVITAIAPAHIENLGSMAAIADAKGEIFQGLEPGGTAIVPYDTPHRDQLIAHARAYAEKVITFGRQAGADVYPRDVLASDKGTLVTAVLPGVDLSFTLAQPGDHWVSNAMAVLAAVQALGGDLAAAGLSFAEMEGLAGRGARHRIATAGGSALLIDESYNANSVSMAATLAMLGAVPARRRIVVLGEMRELGAESEALHAGLAQPVLDAGVETALLVGPGMAPLAAALGTKIRVEHLPDAASALERVRGLVDADDAVLVKGSNAVGLARVVAGLISGED